MASISVSLIRGGLRCSCSCPRPPSSEVVSGEEQRTIVLDGGFRDPLNFPLLVADGVPKSASVPCTPYHKSGTKIFKGVGGVTSGEWKGEEVIQVYCLCARCGGLEGKIWAREVVCTIANAEWCSNLPRTYCMDNCTLRPPTPPAWVIHPLWSSLYATYIIRSLAHPPFLLHRRSHFVFRASAPYTLTLHFFVSLDFKRIQP